MIIIREPITNKQQMYDLLCANELGNHFSRLLAPDWLKSEFYNRLNYDYSIRYGLELGGPWKYHILSSEVVSECISNEYKCPMKEIWVTSMPKDVKHTINGELQRAECGLELHYSIQPTVMREALKIPIDVKGLTAKYVLEHYCNPKSYDMLMELLDLYPDHVIEFTVFNKDVGVMPGHNTIVWEVRRY